MPDVFHAPSNARAESLAGRPLASFGKRALALALDFAIAGAIFLAAVMLLGTFAASRGWIAADRNVNLQLNFFGNWYSVVWLVSYFSVFLWLGHGRTPGKWIVGIRVVSIVHDHLTFWHSIERALGYGASTLEAGFGFLQYFLRDDRRTVHDRIAETIVIDEPRRRRG